MDKRSVFKMYNRLKHSSIVDKSRLNKALSLAMRKESPERPYYTTLQSCTCPDAAYRGQICKHRLALMISQPQAGSIQLFEEELQHAGIRKLTTNLIP